MFEKTRPSLRSQVVSSVILGALLILGATLPAQAADAGHGARVFKIQCKECHSARPGKNKRGPSLFGVVGRHAASMPGYRYSKAMKRSGLTWTKDKLDSYLTAPRKVVPHCKMSYKGLAQSGARADLIAFLSSLQ